MARVDPTSWISPQGSCGKDSIGILPSHFFLCFCATTASRFKTVELAGCNRRWCQQDRSITAAPAACRQHQARACLIPASSESCRSCMNSTTAGPDPPDPPQCLLEAAPAAMLQRHLGLKDPLSSQSSRFTHPPPPQAPAAQPPAPVPSASSGCRPGSTPRTAAAAGRPPTAPPSIHR